MSRTEIEDPTCAAEQLPDGVDLVIVPRTGDIGGFKVQRALPSRQKRMIGPFIFWDEMGPGEFLEGHGLDVRPHPHIGLSTVTYLFKGEMDHKDSLGTAMTITPGAVNLMTAGSGIVHSERSGPEARARRSSLYGIQSWLALPKPLEETDPAFAHYGAAELPELRDEGKAVRLIMGEAYGMRSPVKTAWDTLYADLRLEAGAHLPLPHETEERGLFIVSGALEIDAQTFGPGCMVSLKAGADISVRALEDSHVMMLGGAAMDGPRYIWWNFVSSPLERLHAAATDWQARAFPPVPGDDKDFIPLPDARSLDRINP